jgi:hypothetical protein
MNSDNTYKTVEYKVDGEDITVDMSYTAQDIDDMLNSTLTSSIGAQGSSGSFLISTGANGTSWGPSSSPYMYTTNNTGNYTFTNPSINTVATDNGSQLHVKGDTVIEGDLKVDGVSFKETIQSINKRLAILVPDPAKLEHFEALQKAYKHYKTLESLCELPTTKEEK